VRTDELLKLLKKYNVVKIREGGNHSIYYSKITGKSFAVGRHSKEIPTGTVAKILRDAGIKLKR
jgi:predicted RNA binding protein YcfA (HicA-like mRNA interferase family)